MREDFTVYEHLKRVGKTAFGPLGFANWIQQGVWTLHALLLSKKFNEACIYLEDGNTTARRYETTNLYVLGCMRMTMETPTLYNKKKR